MCMSINPVLLDLYHLSNYNTIHSRPVAKGILWFLRFSNLKRFTSVILVPSSTQLNFSLNKTDTFWFVLLLLKRETYCSEYCLFVISFSTFICNKRRLRGLHMWEATPSWTSPPALPVGMCCPRCSYIDSLTHPTNISYLWDHNLLGIKFCKCSSVPHDINTNKLALN